LAAEVVSARYRWLGAPRAAAPEIEATGVWPPLFEGGFAGYCHRPDELRCEVSVEGIAFALADLDERLREPEDRAGNRLVTKADKHHTSAVCHGPRRSS
jgi:hypothetical protein